MVHFIKFNTGNVNSASYNRFLHITQMTSINFDVYIHETRRPGNFISKFKILRGSFWIFEFVRIIKEIINNRSEAAYLILYLFNINFFMAAYLSFMKKKHKFICISERNEFPISYMKNYRIRFFFERKILFPWFYNVFNGYTVISDELYNYYKKYLKSDRLVKKLLMTVDFNRFNEVTGGQNNADYLFFAGSLNKDKDGVDLLIRAFDKFSNRFNNMQLLIAGNSCTKDLNSIRELIARTNNKNIILLGEVKRDDIPNYMVNAKACVLPRPDSKQARGGFPTKLGEYLASESPTIVTDVGEIPSLLSKDEVFLIDKGNIEEELYKTLVCVFSDYNNAKSQAKLARCKAQQLFSLEKNALTIKELINEVILNSRDYVVDS